MQTRSVVSVESKMATMQHKIFCVRKFINTESGTAVQRTFRFRFNILHPFINFIVSVIKCNLHNIFH